MYVYASSNQALNLHPRGPWDANPSLLNESLKFGDLDGVGEDVVDIGEERGWRWDLYKLFCGMVRSGVCSGCVGGLDIYIRTYWNLLLGGGLRLIRTYVGGWETGMYVRIYIHTRSFFKHDCCRLV